MHSYKNLNVIKGFVIGLVFLIGVGFLIFYFRGFIDVTGSFLWIIVAIAGGLIVLAISGIILLPRARINKYPSRSYGIKESDNYKSFQKTELMQENDFEPSKKMILSGEAKFCDYCGIVLEEDLRFCTNCGNKIQ
jgi:hypothetical protein